MLLQQQHQHPCKKLQRLIVKWACQRPLYSNRYMFCVGLGCISLYMQGVALINWACQSALTVQ
jgi:hypothetical protein